MAGRSTIAVATAALVIVPLVFDPASARPFVGSKVVATLACGALAVAAVTVTGGVGRLWRPALWAGAAYVASLAIASAFSLAPVISVAGDYYRGMGLVTRLALVAIGLAAAVGVAAEPQRAIVLLRCTLTLGTVVAVYTIAQLVGLDPVIDSSWLEQTSRSGVTELRAVSTLGHANFVGQFLLFGTGAAAGLLAFETNRVARAAVVAAGLVVATGVVAAGSRGAWLGLAVQVVAALVIAWRRGTINMFRKKSLGVIGLVAAIVVAVALAFGLSPAGRHIAERARTFQTDAMTGSSRTLLWRDALPMVPRYLPTGCGPEAFVLAFLPYIHADLERAEPYALFDSSHNVPLDYAISTGALGLGSWIALVAIGFLAAGRARRGDAARAPVAECVYLAVTIGLMGYVAHAQFIFETIAPALCFFVFAGIAVGCAAEPPPEGAAPSKFTEYRLVAGAAVVLVAVLVLGPRLRLALLADRQMQTALVFAADGRLQEAVASGRASVANAERFAPAPELRHLLARIYERAGDPSRRPSPDETVLLRFAETNLEEALRTSNTPHLLHAELADIALRFADTARARTELDTSIAIAPAFWPTRVRLAELLRDTGDADGARREASRALELNPESEAARGILASVQPAP